MHAHVAAMRYAVKLLLRDLWIAWRSHLPEGTSPASDDTLSSQRDDGELVGGMAALDGN